MTHAGGLRAARVLRAADAAALDSDAAAAGIPSRALMQRAGAAAATEMVRRLPHLLADGVHIFTGAGNNGGDGWVVARALATAGIRVAVSEAAPAKTDDAKAERGLARPLLTEPATGRERILVDALLGTGSRGAPRGAVARAVEEIVRGRERGATVVALDVPSGVDSDTGEATVAVRADLTLTFAAVKRGLLAARAQTGTIVVLDIGLGEGTESYPELVQEHWVRDMIPAIAVDAHKGARGRLAIVGGGGGMTGAAVLAARAAMRSGIGLVRVIVPRAALPIVQGAEPHALAHAWPVDDEGRSATHATLSSWAHIVLLGPGLGDTDETRALAREILREWRGPVVVDADGLNVFAGNAKALGELCTGRPALLTPHVAEAARLLDQDTTDVAHDRYEAAARLASLTQATVLLKGVPSIITAPDGRTMVSATGTPALAAAGSGDLLAGISASLLSRTADALVAGACAAWVHGRAGEVATRGRAPRGVPLSRVLEGLELAWNFSPPPPSYPAILELPAVAES
ncbi:MAG TPA: NAD(P)H-hydrate dehydratase [Gemmatimonadaceae bacterium]|nr:NAD(P)H-hydrate dehydratase [Gemmatimonadaceae bacterium]